MFDVNEARRHFDAVVEKAGSPERLLAYCRKHGIRASRGASCGADSLMASFSNFLSAGTAARVERDCCLSVIDGKGAENYGPLQEPARAVELAHQEGRLPAEFYGEPVRPAIDFWPSATAADERQAG